MAPTLHRHRFGFNWVQLCRLGGTPAQLLLMKHNSFYKGFINDKEPSLNRQHPG